MKSNINEPKYELKDDGSFVIENYNQAKPFSSFFPGIAGLYGIPMWAFYVNRGQGIAAFGVRNKSESIMEFYPANNAYAFTPSLGFRTFLKVTKKSRTHFYEPFKIGENPDVKQRMIIRPYEMAIEDENLQVGIATRVTYFTLPNEPLAALVRIVEVSNLSKDKVQIEMVDGMPKIMPYWIDQWVQKFMSNTAQAWVTVENALENAVFYRLKIEINDVPEVHELTKGNFLTAYYGSEEDLKSSAVIVDPKLIFGQDNSYSYPFNFFREGSFTVAKDQFGANKYPSAFGYSNMTLMPKDKQSIYSVIGHVDSLSLLKSYAKSAGKKSYFERKKNENKELIDSLTDDIITSSSSKVFDLYARQTYLDNLMRGGKPIVFRDGEKKSIFYVYSRKHGDLERDYNNFELSPHYYSQGNGNYRDTNQNKRNDVFFNPQIGDFNVKYFYNLIQLDGFNPLVVKGQKFLFDASNERNKKVISDFVEEKDAAKLTGFFSRPFEPGALGWFIDNSGIKTKYDKTDFIAKAVCASKELYEAEHGEGFWTDHWTYNLDLLERYLSVYPEKAKEILLDKREFTFFDSAHIVLPRSRKYVETNGKVRQFGAVSHDKIKDQATKARSNENNVVRDKNGQIYTTNLITKMLCLLLNKLASLDPEGIGIEMEADKPSWYDSLNGLPGVFGSSVSETFELRRNLEFLRDQIASFNLETSYNFFVPIEMFDFFKGLDDTLSQMDSISDYAFWDWAYSAKEYYRSRIISSIDGWEKEINVSWLLQFIEKAIQKVDKGLAKAIDENTGLYFTYFRYEAKEYEKTGETGHKGFPCVRIKSFTKHALPLFLEAEVHYLKTLKVPWKVRQHFELLKQSPLFDKNLQMYKLNASLKDEPLDLGRATVFPPGWLENESIWLHMEYKYLLELLKAELYGEFFEQFKKTGICFQDPARYGRSILENSSFIASSAFPDKSEWGRGFVARLSGSTAEFIHMWLLITIGPKPFYLDENGNLVLELKPAIPKEFFTKEGIFEFKFLGKTMVRYHNSKNIDTFSGSSKIDKTEIFWQDGKKEKIAGAKISGERALRVRSQEAREVDVYF